MRSSVRWYGVPDPFRSGAPPEQPQWRASPQLCQVACRPHPPELRHWCPPCRAPPPLGWHSRHRRRVGLARDKNTGLAMPFAQQSLCAHIRVIPPYRPRTRAPPASIPTPASLIVHPYEMTSLSVADPSLSAHQGDFVNVLEYGASAPCRESGRGFGRARVRRYTCPHPRAPPAPIGAKALRGNVRPPQYFRTDIEGYLDFSANLCSNRSPSTGRVG